ncbi:MAG: glycosyltransferase family 4 protein [Bacteroidales bacterium]|nr:glycosyltransferase family 4 protein [Bacteroidales bacterium]
MNIAYIVPKLAQKGPVTVAYELVCQMMAHGHTCTVFYFDGGPDQLGFPCVTRRISWRKGRGGGRAADGGPGGLDFNRFDIVHSHGLRPDAYVCLHKPARSHARCISTLHNYVFDDLRYQYNRWTAFWAGRAWLAALRRHDTVVTLSQDALRYYSRFLPQRKLTYAYNTRRLPAAAQDLQPLSEAEITEATAFPQTSPTQAATPAPTAESATRNAAQTPIQPRPYLIGVHAELTARKGIDQLLRVLPQLPDHRLLVIGDGRERAALERLVAEKGVAGRVRFLGRRPNAYLYLPLYDLYALPSRSEGFPLALLEAAAHGSAVVCSDLPVFKELVTENEVAFFASENPDSLREALLKATARKAKLAQQLHARYLAAFSPEHFYERYLEIYEAR